MMRLTGMVGLALIALLVGCGPEPMEREPAAEEPDGDADIRGAWDLIEATGPDGPIRVDKNGEPVRLGVGSESLRGSYCNRYEAPYSLKDEVIEVGQIHRTEMACTDHIEAEDAYLSALKEAHRVRLQGERLRIAGPDIELVYEPAVEREDLQGHWELEEATGSDGLIPTEGHQGDAVLLYVGGEQLTGMAHCNEYFAHYSLEGDVIEVEGLSQTDMGCPDVGDAEDAYLSALSDVDRMRLEGERLRLAGPHIELIYERAEEPE